MAQATPRSLRSFLDATPSDILDTSFQSLVFIPRSEHDGLLEKLAGLQGQLAQTQKSLDEVRQKQDPDGNTAYDTRGHHQETAGETDLQQLRLTDLESKNIALDKENLGLIAAAKESESKARSLKSEVAKLRNRLSTKESDTPERQPQTESTDSGLGKEKARLEEMLTSLESENSRLQGLLEEADKELFDLRGIIPAADELGNNFKNLQSENDSINEERKSLQISVAQISQQNSQLYTKVESLEGDCAALRRTNQEIMASLTKHEQENKFLISRNHDLANESAKLEKESHKLQKQLISQDTAYETLNESMSENNSALKSEIKELQEKLNGTRDPEEDARYQADLRSRNEKLRGDNSEMRAELRRLHDMIIELRRDNRELCAERVEMIRDIRELKGHKLQLLDENESWRNKFGDMSRNYDDASRRAGQLQKESQFLQARLTAAQHSTRREVDAISSAANSRPQSLTKPSSPAIDKNHELVILPARPVDSASKAQLANNGQKENGQKGQLPQELPRVFKRKAFVTPQPEIALPTTPNKPDKRQKITGGPDTSSFRRRGAVYLVHVPLLVNYSVLRSALAKLGSEVEGLRRVFYDNGCVNEGTERWVVKFVGVPKEFVKHVYVSTGVFATLTAGSGTTCLICEDSDDHDHDIWECQYLGADGQERPSLNQYEMSLRPQQKTPLTGSKRTQAAPTVTEGQPPRTLFDRVTLPDGRRPNYPRRAGFDQAEPSDPSIENARGREARVSRLINLTRKEKRGLFCRFTGYTPNEEQFLSIISGGPVERVKTMDDAVGFVDFVYPADAERFLKHAVLNISGNHIKFRNPKLGLMDSMVEFVWSETAVKPMDSNLAEGIVGESWSRVILLLMVPKVIGVKRIINDCGGQIILSWISESDFYPGPGGKSGRDVTIEFVSIKDAKLAYDRLSTGGYKDGLKWGVEDCTRPLQ